MNFEKTRVISSDVMKLLKQIFSDGKVSALEKDLLKEKLRALYEAIDEPTDSEPDATPDPEELSILAPSEVVESGIETKVEKILDMAAEPVNTYKPAPERSFLFIDDVADVETSAAEAQSEETVQEPENYSLPKSEELDNELNNEKLSTNGEQSVGTESKELMEQISPVSETIEENSVYEKTMQVNTLSVETRISYSAVELDPADKEALDELFFVQEAKELSDKLSLSPIQDLSKALGLNDRLLTVNELFGGDFSLFDESFRTLNTLDSFDDAKTYLVEKVVMEKGWLEPSRKDRAKRFIKFIKRRYIQQS